MIDHEYTTIPMTSSVDIAQLIMMDMSIFSSCYSKYTWLEYAPKPAFSQEKLRFQKGFYQACPVPSNPYPKRIDIRFGMRLELVLGWYTEVMEKLINFLLTARTKTVFKDNQSVHRVVYYLGKL
jgi:hypothetical protein